MNMYIYLKSHINLLQTKQLLTFKIIN